MEGERATWKGDRYSTTVVYNHHDSDSRHDVGVATPTTHLVVVHPQIDGHAAPAAVAYIGAVSQGPAASVRRSSEGIDSAGQRICDTPRYDFKPTFFLRSLYLS